MGTNERLNDIPHAERRFSRSRLLDDMSPLCQRIVPLFAEYKSSIDVERSALNRPPHFFLRRGVPPSRASVTSKVEMLI